MSSADTPPDDGPNGDPSRHLSLAELDRGLGSLPAAPSDQGRVVVMVARREGGVRATPQSAELTAAGGMPGDAWSRKTPEKVEAQLAVIEGRVAQLIANGQPLSLSGDNLVLDLDLSADNLPVGSRLAAGKLLLEVTPKPHNGCRKFRARFGADALRFVARPETRHLNLRGIYLRVIEAGTLRVGDTLCVVSRPDPRTSS